MQPSHYKSAEFMLVIGFSDDLQDAVLVLVLSCFVLVLTNDLPITKVISKTRFNFKGGAFS